MYSEENYMTYIENGEGCCDSVMVKLRKKKHAILITSLLILALVAVVSGLYNGLTFKKYSDLAILVGIFFPTIILVFVCAYLAFICGRESFRRSALLHHLSNGNHSHHSQVSLQYPQPNSATRRDLKVPKVRSESINGSVATRNEELPYNKIFYTTDGSADNCEAKISRRHFRSFSNSDISNQMPLNNDILSKNPEICKVNYRGTTDDNHYSPRFGRHQDATQRKRFKRSVSDMTNKSKNKNSRKDKTVWNTNSFENLRRRVDKLNSVKEAEVKSEFNFPCETTKRPSERSCSLKNYKTIEDQEIATRFKEYAAGVQRYSNRQGKYPDTSFQEDNRKKSSYTKSEIHLYSSNVLKLPDEYEQSFRFSNLPPGRNESRDIEDTANCSSGDEKNGPFFKSNRTSEQGTRCFRGKAFYFPSSTNNDLARSSREYAHEFCRH